MYGSGPRGGDQVRIGGGTEVPRSYGQRLTGERDRLEIVLESRALAPVARGLGKDDALTQDGVALGLLHTGSEPAPNRSGRREEACEPRALIALGLPLGLELYLELGLRFGLGFRRR